MSRTPSTAAAKAATSAAAKLHTICDASLELLRKPVDSADMSSQQLELVISCCKQLTALQEAMHQARATDKLLSSLLHHFKAAESFALVLSWIMLGETSCNVLAEALLLPRVDDDAYSNLYQLCMGCLISITSHTYQLTADQRKRYSLVLFKDLDGKGVFRWWCALVHRLGLKAQHRAQQQCSQQHDSPLRVPAMQQTLRCWARLWDDWKHLEYLAYQSRDVVSMLREVQWCIKLLPRAAVADAGETGLRRAADSMAVSAARSSSQQSDRCTAQHLASIQHSILTVMYRSVLSSQQQTWGQRTLPHMVVGQKSVAEAATQLLIACCLLLRRQLASELKNADVTGQLQQAKKLRQALQGIPAYHSSMLQQMCLAGSVYMSAVHDMHACSHQPLAAPASDLNLMTSIFAEANALLNSCEALITYLDVLGTQLDALEEKLHNPVSGGSPAPLATTETGRPASSSGSDAIPLPLSCRAVQLSIELQLLLSTYVSFKLPWQTGEQQQQQQAQPALRPRTRKGIQANPAEAAMFLRWPGTKPAAALLRCNNFLLQQLHALQYGGKDSTCSNRNCAVIVVLQQSGTHLLQALGSVLPVFAELWQFMRLDVWTQLAPVLALGWHTQAVLLDSPQSGAACSTASMFARIAPHAAACLALIECCTRSPLLDAQEMLLPFWTLDALVQHGRMAMAPAAAPLVSALVSITKRVVLMLKAVPALQEKPATANDDDEEDVTTAARHFPAVITPVMHVFLTLADALPSCVSHSSSKNSAGGPRETLSVLILLIVVLSRCLVVLADAMEDAAAAVGSTPAQLLARSLMAKPTFNKGWSEIDDEHIPVFHTVRTLGRRQELNTAGQWKMCQLSVLAVINKLLAMHGATKEAAVAMAAHHDVGRSRWSYLIHMQTAAQMPAAEAAFASKREHLWQAIWWYSSVISKQDETSEPSISAAADTGLGDLDAGHVSSLYSDALGFCRALVAAAPLPLVCNYPACENLSGVSETAIALKMCAGCRCRYCSAACQAADWKRHRKACKHMAAARETCE